MSFADDELFEEPAEEPVRPSRRSRGGGGAGRSGGGPRAPRGGGTGGSPLQQPRVRAMIALGLLVIVALILISTVRGCQRDKVVDSYRTYLGQANAIATESEGVGKELRKLLDNEAFNKRQAIIAKVAALATKSTAFVERAKNLDPPDRLGAPNRTLVTALEYRAQGLSQLPAAIDTSAVAKDIPSASATLAAPLQVLAASDVIYRNSYKLPAQNAIQDDRIKDANVAASEFFPGNTYDKTSPAGAKGVIVNIKRSRPSTGSGAGTGTAGAGSVHGLSISSVFAVRAGAAKKQLIPGTTTQLAPSDDLKFEVTIDNGGDFSEANIDVTFTYVSPSDPTGIVKTETITEIAAGAPAVLTFALERAALYLEAPSSITIKVTPVPEEKVESNNTFEYPVEFNVQ